MYYRASVLAVQSPILTRIGYGLTWMDAAVITWGGLRGAVGLAMGLMVAKETALDPTGFLQNKVSNLILISLVNI